MLRAATPVGAQTTTFLSVFCLKYCNNKDFPVPAFPVKKIGSLAS